MLICSKTIKHDIIYMIGFKNNDFLYIYKIINKVRKK